MAFTHLSETSWRPKQGFAFATLSETEQLPPGSWNKMTVNVFCFGADITCALGPFVYSGAG